MGTRLKLLAGTALAASTIGIAGTVGAPEASAASKYTCRQAYALSATYLWCAEYDDSVGNTVWAAYYRGKSAGLIEASC